MSRLWRLLVLHFMRRGLTPAEHLERALWLMPRRDREIWLAHFLEGMGYVEIADRTGLSVDQVEQAMVRAFISIHRHLRDCPRK